MNKWVCIKEFNIFGWNVEFCKSCYSGKIYYLEEVFVGKTSYFWQIFDETTGGTRYIGIVFNLDNFISLSEWRDSQINSLLDG